MNRIIARSILMGLLAWWATIAHTYAQGTKLSSFPLASIIDTNITLVGVWDSAGRKLDKRYPLTLFSGALSTAFTLDQVLYNGNQSAYTARFTDYAANFIDVNYDAIDIYAPGHQAHLTAGTLEMRNYAGGYAHLTTGANPSVGMSNVSGSHIGYVQAPTITGDRIYRLPDSSGTIALTEHLSGFITSVDSGKFATRERVQKAVDSLGILIGTGGGGNLQATLTAGNKTNKTALFGNSIDTTYITPDYIATRETSNRLVFAGGNWGGSPSMLLGSSGGYPGVFTMHYAAAYANNTYWVKDKGGATDTFAMVSDLASATDSSVFSTKKWRQKGIDSLSALISSIPGIHAPGSPNVTLGPGAGTAPGLVTVNADDLGGQVAFSTGTSPGSAPGTIVFRLTFHTPFATPPKAVLLTPANYNAALLGLITADVSVANITTTYFEVVTNGAAIGASGAYSWFFLVHP